tara:strand:- start:5627 stop:5950 length:324 start_codon:yes stop_codon:yes gene_type:complete
LGDRKESPLTEINNTPLRYEGFITHEIIATAKQQLAGQMKYKVYRQHRQRVRDPNKNDRYGKAEPKLSMLPKNEPINDEQIGLDGEKRRERPKNPNSNSTGNLISTL